MVHVVIALLNHSLLTLSCKLYWMKIHLYTEFCTKSTKKTPQSNLIINVLLFVIVFFCSFRELDLQEMHYLKKVGVKVISHLNLLKNLLIMKISPFCISKTVRFKRNTCSDNSYIFLVLSYLEVLFNKFSFTHLPSFSEVSTLETRPPCIRLKFG